MRALTADQQRFKELVSVFNTPIVFHPGGWEDTLPDWLKTRVIKERVAMVENGGWDKATDAEVTCYLYTASLTQPLGSDWTEITLYEAAKQIPQLNEVVPATPKELSDYQKHELENLKRKIRDSQLKRQNKSKKEGLMSKRKLILDEREGRVIIGVMADDSDPILAPASENWPSPPVEGQTIPTTLEDALPLVPACIKKATEAWAVSKRRPAYKAPPEPKKETKPAAKTAAAGKSTEELPLLSGTETTPPAGETKPTEGETGAPEVETAVAEVKAEAVVEDKTQQVEKEVTPAAGAPAAIEAATTGTGAATQTPSPTPAGQFEYFLEDGRGPYKTVQDAMDAKGLDKATRPQHNRWDRLSTELKKAIRRVEKKV